MADKMSSSKKRIEKVEELILSRIHLPNGIDDTDLTALFSPGHLNIYIRYKYLNIRYKYSNIKSIVRYICYYLYFMLLPSYLSDDLQYKG